MKKLTMLAACVAVATMASSVAYAAPAVDFSGTYFRASVGSSRDGGQFTQNKNFSGVTSSMSTSLYGMCVLSEKSSASSFERKAIWLLKP